MKGGTQQTIDVIPGHAHAVPHVQRPDGSTEEVSPLGPAFHQQHMEFWAVMSDHQARKTCTAAQIDNVPGIRRDTRDVLPSVGQFNLDIGRPDDADALRLAQDLDQVVVRHPPA